MTTVWRYAAAIIALSRLSAPSAAKLQYSIRRIGGVCKSTGG